MWATQVCHQHDYIIEINHYIGNTVFQYSLNDANKDTWAYTWPINGRKKSKNTTNPLKFMI